jgi:hypothetical protein
MENGNINLFDIYDTPTLLTMARAGLERGTKLGMTNFNIIDISIKNKALLIDYQPNVKNKVAIYCDISQVMGFISGLFGADSETRDIHNIGVQAIVDGKPFIYILSSIDSAKAIGRGEAIYWLKNSIINDMSLKEVYLLVEGETEVNAYPILFEARGYPLDPHLIKIIPYSNERLKTVLSILDFTNEKYYLTCDRDKTSEIADFKREGYFGHNNCYILSKGEFEDYVEAQAIVVILEKITPGIGITTEYVEENRTKGKKTSKIILDYYYIRGTEYVFPGKPELGKEIAHFWIERGIPEEIEGIILNVMNIA